MQEDYATSDVLHVLHGILSRYGSRGQQRLIEDQHDTPILPVLIDFFVGLVLYGIVFLPSFQFISRSV